MYMRGISGKMIGHVALVAIAEIVAHVLRPLIGLGQEHPAPVMGVHHRPHLFDHRVGFGQILVGGALAHAQVGNGVQPQPVHAQIQPEAHDRITALTTAGLLWFKSGWWEKKRCQ
jgi:hypothetical protein